MNDRSRTTARTQNRIPNTSNSSARRSSRVRSTTARDRSSPYGSFARRSNANNDENQLSFATSKRPKKNRRSTNNQRDASESYLSNDELNQIIVPDQSDDNDESLQDTSSTTIQGVNSQSSSAHATLTNNLVQNLSLNDIASTTSTTLQGQDSEKNYFMNNEKVYKLFDVTTNGLFRCKSCQQVLKSKQYHTTNLRKHIGLVHKQTEYLYPSQRKNYLIKSSSIANERRKELHLAVISCIIKDSRPFNDFRKSGMREFLDVAVPGYVPPHRTTVKANLIERYRQHRHLLRTVLAKVPEIALTSDVWKNSRGTHFICLTAHFFDRKYGNVSLTIGFRQLIGDHIAERLRKYILYELESLQIQNKICSITTDNASNIVCATVDFPYFGDRFSCLAHDFNLIIQDGLHLQEKTNDKDSSDDQPASFKNKTLVDTIDADVDNIECSSSDEDEDEDGETEKLVSGDLRDDEESLNEDFEDEAGTEPDNNAPSTDDTLTNIYYLVDRARRFIRLTRRTFFVRDYLRQEAQLKELAGDELILDCIIRWNSSFYMINRFIDYQDVINPMTSNPRIISPKITASMIYRLKEFIFLDEEWSILIAIRNVLAEFEEACRLISGKKYQTLSVGYLVLIGLENTLTKPLGTGPQAEIELILRQSLYTAFRYHISDKVNTVQKNAMMIACYLDPETNYLMDDDKKDEAQQLIIDEARNRNLSAQIIPVPRVSTNTNNSTSSNKINRLNNFLIRCGLQPRTTNSADNRPNRTINEELAFYINKVDSNTPFEDFWTTYERELPCLSVLVRSFNIRPVTSVPSESLFSIASYTNRKQRSSLSPRTLCYSMILRDAEVLKSLI